MGTGMISFPGLGINNLEINRVIFRIFGQNVYWYGVIIALGIIAAIFVASYLCKKANLDSDKLFNMFFLAVIFGIPGARIYYVLFTLDYYNSFWDMINIRDGGLAIYGAIIAGLLAILVYCKIKKLNFWAYLDVFAPAVLIAQCIGRWGNFVNQEAFGGLTNLPWRMEIILGGEAVAVHPTFLYESLWNLVGFILLMCIFKRRRWNGQIFVIYAGWYGLGRMIIEGLRADSLMLGQIRVSQIVAGLCVIAAIVILIVNAKKRMPEAAAAVQPAEETEKEEIKIDEPKETAEVTAPEAAAEETAEEAPEETPEAPVVDVIEAPSKGFEAEIEEPEETVAEAAAETAAIAEEAEEKIKEEVVKDGEVN